MAPMGPSAPTSRISPQRYYGPYLGGHADIQSPENHPLSQDEIDWMRRSNGIPKGGLL